MRVIVKNLIKIYFRAVLFPLRIRISKLQISSFETILGEQQRIARNLGFFSSFQFTPIPDPGSVDHHIAAEIGILIQGPIRSKIELSQVQETIVMYSKFFPGAQIVLSSWNNSFLPTNEFARKHGVRIITSEDPGPSWPSNLLRQIISTANGLNAFCESDKLLVMKSRTDQRVTNPLTFEYLRAILSCIDNGNQRLWATDYGTGRNRLYGLTDQMQFGNLRVLQDYWAVKSIDELHLCITRQQLGDPVILSRNSVAVHEILLAIKYLEKRGHTINWTWQDHLDTLREFFGIIDSRMIGLELLSRDRNVIDHVLPGMKDQKARMEQHLSYENWLLAYSRNSITTPSIQEQILALKVPESDLFFVDRVWKNYSLM